MQLRMIAALALLSEAAACHIGLFRPKLLHFCINEANRTHAVLPMCSNTVHHAHYMIPCQKYTNVQSNGCVLLPARLDPRHPHSDPHTLTRSPSLTPSLSHLTHMR